MAVTLYHGTTRSAAEEIRNCGYIRGDAYFTPLRAIADDYAGADGVVIAVTVATDETELHIDLESYDDYDGISIDEAVSKGLSVYARGDVRVR